MQKVKHCARPLLVKNATSKWAAMDSFSFEFFKDLYFDLEEENCQFFAWNFQEFRDLIDVFEMPEFRWQMKKNFEPWYVGWQNCDSAIGDILRSFYPTPFFLPEDSKQGSHDWIFMGTPGYGAPFHLDSVKYPSWQAQVLFLKIAAKKYASVQSFSI